MKSQDLILFRNQIEKAEKSKELTLKLYENAEKSYKTNPKLEYKIYIAMSFFYNSKHSFNPINKFKNFNKGKLQMDEIIKENPKLLEARFYRYLVQINLPKFLNYNNIIVDKTFVKNNINSSSDEDLKQRIKLILKL